MRHLERSESILTSLPQGQSQSGQKVCLAIRCSDCNPSKPKAQGIPWGPCHQKSICRSCQPCFITERRKNSHKNTIHTFHQQGSPTLRHKIRSAPSIGLSWRLGQSKRAQLGMIFFLGCAHGFSSFLGSLWFCPPVRLQVHSARITMDYSMFQDVGCETKVNTRS